MADALRQYWYLGIALIAAVILTLWVIKKAAQASSRAHAEREAQMKKLEYESGVLKEFSELSEEKLRNADSKRAFDGVAMNIQRYLEKQSNMNAAFSALSDSQRQIYALYYLIDDSQKGLSEFFKCRLHCLSRSRGRVSDEKQRGISRASRLSHGRRLHKMRI